MKSVRKPCGRISREALKAEILRLIDKHGSLTFVEATKIIFNKPSQTYAYQNVVSAYRELEMEGEVTIHRNRPGRFIGVSLGSPNPVPSPADVYTSPTCAGAKPAGSSLREKADLYKQAADLQDQVDALINRINSL